MIKSSEIAEICGAIIGDGWIESREKALYIAGHKFDDREYYDTYLAPLFSRTLIKVEPKNYDYWKVYGFGTCNRKVIGKIINLGIKKGKKVYTTEFPEWVFPNKEFMVSALRGFFDADGNFSCKKCYGKYDNNFRRRYHCQPRIEIGSSSKKLILQIFNILKFLGFFPGKVYIKKANSKNGRNNSDFYRIRIDRLVDIEKWFEVFKISANQKHISKYLVWKKFGFCPPKLTPEGREKLLNGEINPYSYYT